MPIKVKRFALFANTSIAGIVTRNPWEGMHVDADEIRRRRKEHGWTQEELGRRLGVGLRTVGSWEQGTVQVSHTKLALLEQVFSGGGPAAEADPSGDPLRAASDVALLAELGRRLARRVTD